MNNFGKRTVITAFVAMAVMTMQPVFGGTPSEVIEYDPENDLTISTPADADAMRDALIQYVWKGSLNPSAVPDEIHPPPAVYPTYLQRDIANADHWTRLVTHMEGGLSIRSHFLKAESRQSCLWIQHFGHGDDPDTWGSADLIERVVNAGCDLLLLTMPWYHEHPPEGVLESARGPLWFRNQDHAQFKLMETDSFSPLKYFLHPILTSLNYAISERGPYDFIAMSGLSGGGHMSTLYPALDERIDASFAVAGSMPLYLRAPSWAFVEHYEQAPVPFMDIAGSYQNLYVLASHPNRIHHQLFLRFDSCCYRGTLGLLYEESVRERADLLGGEYRMFYDYVHPRHHFSRRIVDEIIDRASTETGLSFPPATDPCVIWNSHKETLSAGAMHHDGGHAYRVHLPQHESSADIPGENRSTMIVCEDNQRLWPDHQMHVDIRQHGGGRNSHYGDGLWFSARDNSDPRTNGHTYSVIIPPQ